MNSRSSRQMRRALRLAPAPSPQRQRGAAAVFAAAAMIAAVAAMLLGINVGILYYAQRDLQRLATLGATAGVESASGCNITTGTSTAGVPGSQAAVQARVLQALTGNSTSSTNVAGLMTGIGGQPAVQVGRSDYTTGKFIFVPLTAGDAKVDSVRVNLSRTAPTLVGSLFSNTPVTIYASSTAWQPALGSFFLGTGLANLDSNSGLLLGPLLNALFGSSVNLAVLNSAGLAQTQVNLAQLMLAANVTDLHSLTNLNTNLTGALNILGQAVSGTGGGLISGLGQQAYNNNGGGPVQNYFGDIFNTVGSGLNPTINDVASTVPFVGAMDLVTALAEDAAKGGTINLQPGNSFLNLLNLPGLASLQTFVTIIQPPQFALGPAIPSTTAKTAQINLAVRASVTVPLVLTANLGVDLNVAAATGTLTSLQCPVAGKANPTATVGVVTNIANLSVGPFDPTDAKHFEPLGNGQLLNVLSGLATVSLNTKKLGPVSVGTLASNSTGPYDTYSAVQGTVTNNGSSLQHQTVFSAVPPDNTDTVGSKLILATTINSLFNSLTANNNLQVCLNVLGLPVCVGALVDPILAALNGLLTPLAQALDTVLQALMQLLGLQLGTATVTMYGATIGQPVVVSNCLPIAGDPTKTNACPILGG